MKRLTDVASLQAVLKGQHNITLVPTMGGLHEGHLSLLRHAKTFAGPVVLSIYVNPLQFTPKEDFEQYPRDIEKDIEKCEGLVDFIYVPTDSQMYPQKQSVGITLPMLSGQLCGASRPSFFEGIAIVVCKLINQVLPQRIILGEKDYQQLVLMRHLISQLSFQVEVVSSPIVRDTDGVAMSSRNTYLSAKEREQATVLLKAMMNIQQRIQGGEKDRAGLENAGRQQIEDSGVVCEYCAIRLASDLSLPSSFSNLIVLVAAIIGKTRLIDNLKLKI